MASHKVSHLTTETFDEAINSPTPVLVDFWAPWCGPCRMVAPVLDQLAEELGDKIKIAKIDIDQNQEIANRFGIQGIPAFAIFQDGQKRAEAVGAMPKSSFHRFIAPHLSADA